MFQHLHQSLPWRAPSELIRPHIERNNHLDYLELASRCRTENSFNRLHIELENICTPLEVAGIANLARSCKIPESGRSWLKKIGRWAPGMFTTPQAYDRRLISWSVILYQNPQCPVDQKDLLIAFSTNARRLMMPISVFLQHVDSTRWDVVVLKKGKQSYLVGMEGISSNFRGLAEYIETNVSSKQYRRVMTIGTSAGGFAAAWAAILMGADRGVSVCGCPPIPLPSSVGDSVPHATDLCYVYGRDCAQDHLSALALLHIFGGRLWPLPEVDRHGALGHLLKRGQISGFLDEMLS